MLLSSLSAPASLAARAGASPRVRSARLAMLAAALLALAGALPAKAADEVRRVDVHFAAGASSASYTGKVRGYNTVEYRLDARAGQVMSVSFKPRRTSAYINVTAPGTDTALFVGSVSGNSFTGTLPADGVYVVQVYLVRAAARRNESSDYSIDFRIDAGTGRVPQPGAPAQADAGSAGAGAPDAMPPVPQPDFADGYGGGPDYWQVAGLTAGDTLNVRSGPSANDAVVVTLDEGAVVRNMGCRPISGARWCRIQLTSGADAIGWVNGRYLREAAAPAAAPKGDALVPGTNYNATGEMACRFKGNDTVRSCPFGVVRAGKSRARVDITFPDGFKRTLRFSYGLVTTSDGSEVSTTRESDNTIVIVNGTERFEVPDVVIEGD